MRGMVKMEFSFKINQGEAELLSYAGESGFVEVPEAYEKVPVTAVGAYAFSEAGPKAAAGRKLYEIRLPGSVKRIGRYAFYGCAGLKKIALTDTLTDIAGGVFTGCRLEEAEIDLFAGEKCCLRDIIAENRYCLRVTLHYHSAGNALQAGRTETAKLIFPEHYEEAVENTPARIVMTEYHGSGGNYRQCVYNKEVDYKRYDEFFLYAQAREEKSVVMELVFGRLLWPYRLTEEARFRYEEYVRREIKEAAGFLIAREETDGLRYLSEAKLWSEDGLDMAVGEAVRTGKADLVSMLMEERHRSFPKKKKVFTW